MSQNGYVSYESFLDVLHILKITEFLGSKENISSMNERMLKKRSEHLKEEKNFAKQIWNKINSFLFNFVDSSILIDFFLIIFYEGDLHTFIDNISVTEDMDEGEIEVNRERNKHLWVSDISSLQHLVLKFKQRVNETAFVKRGIKPRYK